MAEMEGMGIEEMKRIINQFIKLLKSYDPLLPSDNQDKIRRSFANCITCLQSHKNELCEKPVDLFYEDLSIFLNCYIQTEEECKHGEIITAAQCNVKQGASLQIVQCLRRAISECNPQFLEKSGQSHLIKKAGIWVAGRRCRKSAPHDGEAIELISIGGYRPRSTNV